MEQVLIWKQFKISCIKFLIFGQKQNYGMKQIGVFALGHFGPDHVQLTKVNWRLQVNWKNFQEIFCKDFPIHFVVVNHVL